MKLWIGGELDADIADSFREARKAVEESINKVIGVGEYSLPFRDWDVIAILRDDGVFREITEYSGRTGEMDFRLKLDHRSFKRSGKEAREKMIFEMLHRSLLIVRGMSVAGADFDRFVSDVVAVARARGWVL